VPVKRPLGDFRTPEQEIPATGLPGVDWESCVTMNHNWGFNSHDHDFKPVAELIGMLVDTASKGGTSCSTSAPAPMAPSRPRASIGSGPRALDEGERQRDPRYFGVALREGAVPRDGEGEPSASVSDDWPAAGLQVPGLRTPVRRASLLADPGHPLVTARDPQGVTITLPTTAPDPSCSVVLLEFDRQPEVVN
jgi:Alpha-L-fucosidase.